MDLDPLLTGQGQSFQCVSMSGLGRQFGEAELSRCERDLLTRRRDMDEPDRRNAEEYDRS
jgi:hypothetical protein